MARQIEQIIQSKQFPYRTKGDFLRHALHRHVRWLSTLGEVPSVMGQVDTILEIMRDEEMNNDFSLVFAKLEERINSYLSDGDSKEAARLILLIKSHIAEMPSGFWKTKYTKRLNDRFGRLTNGMKKLNLKDIE